MGVGSFINDGTIKLTGASQFGVIVSPTYSYNSAELLLKAPL